MLQSNAASPSSGQEFRRGARDIVPIVIATIPFGLVFGTAASHAQMTMTDSVLLSAMTFAGASQFAALEFWAHPLPVGTILVSVSAVNLRMALYGAAIGRRMQDWSPLARYLGLGLLTDPIVALAELNGGSRLRMAYYFGLAVPLYVNWIATTVLGFIAGSLITNPEVVGLDFMVTAYFIHLLAGFRGRPSAGATILTSLAGSLAAYALLGPPWHIITGAVLGIATAAATVGTPEAKT